MDTILIPLIQQAGSLVNLVIRAVVVAVIVLMILRWLLLRIQPFGWAAYQVRRLTDPMVWPLAQSLPMPNSMSIAAAAATAMIAVPPMTASRMVAFMPAPEPAG